MSRRKVDTRWWGPTNQPTNHSHRWAAAGSELVVFVFGDWTWTTYTSAPSSSSSSSASSSSSTLSPILRVSPFVEIFNFHLWFVTPSFILFQQTDGPVPARHPKCRRHISTTSTTEGRGNQEKNSSWRVKKRRRNVIFSANERPRGRKTRICQIMSSNRSLCYVLLRNVDFTEVEDVWLWSQRI